MALVGIAFIAKLFDRHSPGVRKKVKIRNRYNQVPHLKQDTIWESDKIQKKTSHTRALSQQVATRLDSMTKTNTKNIHKRSMRGSRNFRRGGGGGGGGGGPGQTDEKKSNSDNVFFFFFFFFFFCPQLIFTEVKWSIS